MLGLLLSLWMLAVADGPPVPQVLEVTGFEGAGLVPPTLPGRRPVLVVLHGNADRREWICPEFASLAGGRAWVLCPRGVRRPDLPPEQDRWTYNGLPAVRAEVRAALQALKDRHGDRVDTQQPVLAGFSLGAWLASELAAQDPRVFPLVLAHEGGLGVWTKKRLKAFRKGGGRGLVLGCGQDQCARASLAPCVRAEDAGLWCRPVHVPGLGHAYTPPFATAAAEVFRQLIRHDPRRALP